MPRPLKPPRGAFIATQVIFHPNLSPALKDTLLRLLALAWASNGRYTPPLTYPQLASLIGRSISTVHAHISELRDRHAALRLQSAGDGFIILSFSDAFLPQRKSTSHPPPPDSESSELPDQKEEEELISPEDESNLLLNDHNDHIAQNSQLSDKFLSELRKTGVFPALLGEVIASGQSEDDLRALLAWAQDEQPEKPAPLFIARLRVGARAPDRFYQPPCPSCGRYGKHATDCPRRFLDGAYAEFVEF